MLAQERESETRKARLEVLEKFVGEKLNDAMLRVPAETRNLNERLLKLQEWGSQSQLEERKIASMVDNHQEWQSQVEDKLTDLTTNQQVKEIKFNELLEAQSRESHSRNERLEDKLKRLELQVEEQRRQIVQLEAIPRMTKAELETPEKGVIRDYFTNLDNPLSPRAIRLGNSPLLPTLIPRMIKGELSVKHYRRQSDG